MDEIDELLGLAAEYLGHPNNGRAPSPAHLALEQRIREFLLARRTAEMEKAFGGVR